MPGFWSDPELKKAAEGGDYVKFINIGDEVSGVVKALKKADFDGRTAIEVEFDDGRKSTFGQWLMVRELYMLQPEPGDALTAKWVAESKKGAKTTKVFAGNVTRADGTVEEFDQRIGSD